MMNSESSSGPVEALDGHIDGNYSELSLLSSSGHNTLYRAKRYGQWFVLKGLSPKHIGNPIFEGLLEKEFVLGVGLNHANIARTIAFESIPGVGNCIVMEFIDGMTLDAYMATNPSEQDRLRIANQVLDAMGYYHSLQIVHRDLKPKNILVTRNGRNAKIIDFGLSDSDAYAIFKQPAGSAKFMAPEQFQSDVPIDLRADIYSLGIILNDLLPRRFAKVVARCAKYHREDRYASAAEVRDALQRVDMRRRSLQYVAGAVALVAVTVAASVWLTSRLRPQSPNVLSRIDTVMRIDTIVRFDTIVQERIRTSTEVEVVVDEVARKKREATYDSLRSLFRAQFSRNYAQSFARVEKDSGACHCMDHMFYHISYCSAMNVKYAQNEVPRVELAAPEKEALLQDLILYNIKIFKQESAKVQKSYPAFGSQGRSRDEINAHINDLQALNEMLSEVLY